MKRTAFIVLAALGPLIMTGCVSPRPAITLDAGAFHQRIAAIYVTPIIDGRTDKSEALKNKDFEFMAGTIDNLLYQYGYRSVFVYSWGTNDAISNQSLNNMSGAELSNLVPAESRIFLVTTINDIHTKFVPISLGYFYYITCTLTAIDRERRTAIWSDTATAKTAWDLSGYKARAQSLVLQRVFASLPENKPRDPTGKGGRLGAAWPPWPAPPNP
jgi:hypothetical protein